MKISFFSFRSGGQGLDQPLARLHPATLLMGAVLLLVGIVAVPSIDHFRRVVPLALLLLAGLVLSGARPRMFLRGLRYLAFFLALVFFWPLVSYPNRWNGLQEGAFSATKIVLLYTTGFLLVRSTSRWQIAAVLERVLRPLERMSRVPLMLALTLGWLPELGTAATHLHASFSGRLARGQSHRWAWMRHLPLLLGAYFARALVRAERLSRALVARHFCGRLGPRPAQIPPPLRRADFACLVLLLAGFILSLGM